MVKNKENWRITCRYCGKKVAKGNESFKKLKQKLKSYDMYWFCDNDNCLSKYLNNGEKSLVENE